MGGRRTGQDLGECWDTLPYAEHCSSLWLSSGKAMEKTEAAQRIHWYFFPQKPEPSACWGVPTP